MAVQRLWGSNRLTIFSAAGTFSSSRTRRAVWTATAFSRGAWWSAHSSSRSPSVSAAIRSSRRYSFARASLPRFVRISRQRRLAARRRSRQGTAVLPSRFRASASKPARARRRAAGGCPTAPGYAFPTRIRSLSSPSSRAAASKQRFALPGFRRHRPDRRLQSGWRRRPQPRETARRQRMANSRPQIFKAQHRLVLRP